MDSLIERQSQVYFIKIGKAIKIGYTTNLKNRVASFRGASAEMIRVLAVFPGDRKGERYLHKMFAESRITNEFFHSDFLILEFLDHAERRGLRSALRWITDLRAAQARQKSMTTTERRAEQKYLGDEQYRKLVAERIRQRDADRRVSLRH